ncbi:hypothetical protein LCGC14_0295160 [marine sediment metagenome]|uniref:Uncharacterized protein n=1 Tax=marine sediment metagenome TaxID=412755 RepID=A0A0F9WXX3_9ZZZZ
MKEAVIRGSFSALAGLVFAATSSEWTLWAIEQRRYWKLIPAVFLACLTVFESAQVWKRVDHLIEEATS